jgi:hypothetical protein
LGSTLNLEHCRTFLVLSSFPLCVFNYPFYIKGKLRILRNGYTKQRLDIGIGIVRSSLSSDSSARKDRGWVIDPLGRMRLLGTAAGRGDTECGSGPKRVDLVVFSQRRDFRSPRGLESGVMMYRSTGCRWAHGWIFLALPLSSILLSLYCFSYSRTCARCITLLDFTA